MTRKHKPRHIYDEVQRFIQKWFKNEWSSGTQEGTTPTRFLGSATEPLEVIETLVHKKSDSRGEICITFLTNWKWKKIFSFLSAFKSIAS